jgi:glycine dehydrogenase subunit 1
MSFIPHTAKDTQEMLDSIGISYIEEIFDEIPKSLTKPELSTIPEALNEMQMLEHAQDICKNIPLLKCFLGAGCYHHHIPAAVWDIATRGEFLTSYTPYQPEVSQGSLQVLYEFQSMIAELFALDVANASLYDGATALSEAILMAKRIQKNPIKQKVLIPYGLHPHYKAVLQTILKQQNIELCELAFDQQQGVTKLSALKTMDTEDVFALVILQNNFFGQIEPFDEQTQWAKDKDLLSIACINPILQCVLKAPGEWAETGVDIACAEGQPLGIPMGSGGPLLGLLACKKDYVRQMPGRLVGRTVDSQQKDGFALTLQAREQHIRRGKATSNICTNVGLNASAATIFMSLLGTEGLKRMAENSFYHTHLLIDKLCQLSGVKRLFNGPYFHEAAIVLPGHAQKILLELEKEGILGGLSLEPYFQEFQNTLLVCATEKISEQDIQHYVQVIEKALKNCSTTQSHPVGA